jgi:predicted nucleotidyltransferase
LTAHSIPAEIEATIQRCLDKIEHDHFVRILFAIESGSRAWGFPSPNSDFDVRFVYVHGADWYLSIDKRRDVIELPIEGDLDINGWDLKKALNLLLKPNPVILEWLRSPIVYRSDSDAMLRLSDLGRRTAHLRPSAHHYLHLAETQYRRFIAGNETVPIKKYFYALRPALALAWLRTHPEKPVPMALPDLRAGIGLSARVDGFVDELLALKSETRELGEGPRNSALDAFIETEIEQASDLLKEQAPKVDDLLEEANRLFRDLVAAK